MSRIKKRLERSRKELAKQNLVFKEREALISNLQTKVAAVLPLVERGNLGTAKTFLIDIYKIYPRVAKEQPLLLAAIERCSSKKALTVDNVWETMQKLRNPNFDKIQVISIPMGGKTRY